MVTGLNAVAMTIILVEKNAKIITQQTVVKYVDNTVRPRAIALFILISASNLQIA